MRRALELLQTSIQSEPAPAPAPALTSLTTSDDPLSTPPSSPPEEEEGETTPKASAGAKSHGAPVVESPTQLESPTHESPTQLTLQPKAKHVLIVDDNDINLKVRFHKSPFKYTFPAVTYT